jgi:hypothetical protein
MLNGSILKILSDRLYMSFILYPNFFAKAIMAVMRPFLSERSKSKIKMLDTPEQLS